MENKNLPKFLKTSLYLFIVSCFLISCKNNTKKAEAPPKKCFEGLNNEIILELNSLTTALGYEHDKFNSFTGVRSMALVHLSIHDIFNAIEPAFNAYHYKEKSEECMPLLSAAESTRIILSRIYPQKVDTINKICNKWLNAVEESEEAAKSVHLGRVVAESYINLRKNDAYDQQGNYEPVDDPGSYQFTPGELWAYIPNFDIVKSFTLNSLSQFRVPPPPSIESDIYQQSYNEVKEYGGQKSKARSDEQTSMSNFWAEKPEQSWNRIARIIAADKKTSIVETNRLFALLNANLYDLYLSTFESKYHYNTWRPLTPISKENKNWEPQLRTQPWPGYPSLQAAGGASCAEIIHNFYGSSDITFNTTSSTATEDIDSKQYVSLNDAVNDCADSDVFNGLNFRYATEAGKEQGVAVAKHTYENFLQPIQSKQIVNE